MRMYLTSPGWDKRHSVLSREYSDLPLSCHGNSSAWQLTTQTTVHAERLELARINSAAYTATIICGHVCFLLLGFRNCVVVPVMLLFTWCTFRLHTVHLFLLSKWHCIGDWLTYILRGCLCVYVRTC